MRSLPALLHAMRQRRTRRIDLDEADRLVAGDQPGSHQAGLGTLLDALRAPGTPGELSTEKTTVAAFTAHRKRAARRRTSTRAVLVHALTALALLASGSTAVAARTGNLPAGAQQHAHRLFSALGVPAPRTGPHRDHRAPAPSSTPSGARPATPVQAELSWCADWQPGGPPLSSEDHRRLRAAAGSEDRIPGYCDGLRHSAGPSPAGKPSGAPPTPPTATPPRPPSPSPTVSENSPTPAPPRGPTDHRASPPAAPRSRR